MDTSERLWLPHEIWLSIFRYFATDLQSVLNCSRSCRFFRDLLSDELLWKSMLFERWPSIDEKFTPERSSWRHEFIRHAVVPSRVVARAQHDDEVLYAAFSHNGDMLATASRDGSVRLFKVHVDGTNSRLELASRHQTPHIISFVTFSPDDSKVLAAVRCIPDHPQCMGMLLVLNAATGELVHMNNLQPYDAFAAFISPQCYVTCMKMRLRFPVYTCEVDIVDVATNESQERMVASFHRGQFLHLLFASPTGQWFGYTAGNTEHTNQLAFFRLNEGKFTNHPPLLVDLQGAIVGVMPTPDGQSVIANVRKFEPLVEDDDADAPRTLQQVFTAVQVNALTGEVEKEYTGHVANTPSDAPFLIYLDIGGVDKSLVASGSEDYNAYIWNRHSGVLLARLQGHSDVVSHAVMHPHLPNVMVTASDDHTAALWI